MFDSFAEMRSRNALRLIELVRRHGQVTRAELSRLSGLSKATVSSIADDLIRADLLRETGSIPINKGRFPTGLVFNARARCVAGIMFEDGRASHIYLLDSGGEPLSEQTIRDRKQTPKSLVEKISHLLEDNNYDLDALLSVGLAAPGPIQPGRLHYVEKNKAEIEGQLGCPVFVESLVNCGAMAETLSGANSGGMSLFVRTGQTVRSTIIFEKRIITDQADYGGDLGHTSLGGRTEVCECGSKGCVNAIASESAIKARLGKRERARVKEISDIVDLCKAGNASAIDTVGVAAQAVGQSIGSLMNVLAPLNVVVCGELIQTGSVFWEPLVWAAKRQALRHNFASCKLSPGSKGSAAPAIGAALLALGQTELIRTQ